MKFPESPTPLLDYKELAEKERLEQEEKRKNIEIQDLQLPGPMMRFREWQSTLDSTDTKYYKGNERPQYNEYIHQTFCESIKDSLGVLATEQTTKTQDQGGHGDHKMLLQEGWVLKVDPKLGAKLKNKPEHSWLRDDYVDVHNHPIFLERVASGDYEAQMELAIEYQRIVDEFRQKHFEKTPA